MIAFETCWFKDPFGADCVTLRELLKLIEAALEGFECPNKDKLEAFKRWKMPRVEQEETSLVMRSCKRVGMKKKKKKMKSGFSHSKHVRELQTHRDTQDIWTWSDRALKTCLKFEGLDKSAGSLSITASMQLCWFLFTLCWLFESIQKNFYDC